MDSPHAGAEMRDAAVHLIFHPMTCREDDPEVFRLIRRHEETLSHWFTQRMGYRLDVTIDTARLYKGTYLPHDRPLMAATDRPLSHREHVLLALIIAALSSGPAIVSLHHLVDASKAAAADADIAFGVDGAERRAFVMAVRWLMEKGCVSELHSHVEQFESDASADAVLAIRHDRILMLALPTLGSASTAEQLVDRERQRLATRQWLRARVVEDPVLYREDLTDDEWREWRGRRKDEEGHFDEMFGYILETRAEGSCVIDPAGSRAEKVFPVGGTVGHAALLLLMAMTQERQERAWWSHDDVTKNIRDNATKHASHWRREALESPESVAREVLSLLETARLIERRRLRGEWRLLPASARFALVETEPDAPSRLVQDQLL